MMIRRMIGILLIEISAHHVFAWAEELLSDPDLVAGDGDAARARVVHPPGRGAARRVPATALTEMRDRTFVGESGRRIPGTEVDRHALGRRRSADSLGDGAREHPASCACARSRTRSTGNPRRDEILEGFHALGDEPAPRRAGARREVRHLLRAPAAAARGRTDSEYQLIQDALEQIELADALGIEYVWEVEHHFLEEYSHSSAPEVFLAAASQRTKNIRLGHGIVQTPPPFNHPARIAERIAMLDLVSNGRVDFGTGESSSEAELGGFLDRPDGEARDVGGRAAGRACAA